jgi:hypothetical protein
MNTREKTELLWKVEQLERKLKAATDMMVFMCACLSADRARLVRDVEEQLTELQQDPELTKTQEFDALTARMLKALCDNPLPLESVGPKPK